MKKAKKEFSYDFFLDRDYDGDIRLLNQNGEKIRWFCKESFFYRFPFRGLIPNMKEGRIKARITIELLG